MRILPGVDDAGDGAPDARVGAAHEEDLLDGILPVVHRILPVDRRGAVADDDGGASDEPQRGVPDVAT